MYDLAECADHLVERGYCLLEALFPAPAVENARTRVLENIHLLKNTRPNPSAGHLAGFHRAPEFEPLHAALSTNEVVVSILKRVSHCANLRTIGLSDITVNRSQEWHVDLLRGKYRHHLTDNLCWGAASGGVYKALLYLQSGGSLRVLPRAHTQARPLIADTQSEPEDPALVESITVSAGTVILMDVRLPHRGSSEEELANAKYYNEPKILVSTVLGGDRKPLTKAMELGNFERLMDWDALHGLHSGSPRLFLN